MIGDRQGEWGDEEVKDLRGLWGQGLSAREIGHALGRTRNMVIGKLHRLGLSNGKVGSVRGEKRSKTMTIRRSSVNQKQNNFNRPRGPRKSPPVGARPATTPIAPLNGTGVTILELQRDQCHAIIGSSRPVVGLPHYCGRPAWSETPYCEGHYAAFHQPPRPR